MSLGKGIPSPKPTMGWSIDQTMPLHRLFVKRMQNGRDLKVIITAKNSQTGTGKTTLAFALAHQWHSMYAPNEWQADEHATLDVRDYLTKYRTAPKGTVLLMDEAEQLDSRRAMSSNNVDFSHYWMMMRVRQVTSILTLPSTSALDSRLEELADVWIDVQRRGVAEVHGLEVNSYSKNLQTPKAHKIEWPDVSDHPEMQALDAMKQEKIDRALKSLEEEEENLDPEEAARNEKIRISQKMRDTGMTTVAIADAVGMSQAWVSRYTNNPDNDE